MEDPDTTGISEPAPPEWTFGSRDEAVPADPQQFRLLDWDPNTSLPIQNVAAKSGPGLREQNLAVVDQTLHDLDDEQGVAQVEQDRLRKAMIDAARQGKGCVPNVRRQNPSEATTGEMADMFNMRYFDGALDPQYGDAYQEAKRQYGVANAVTRDQKYLIDWAKNQATTGNAISESDVIREGVRHANAADTAEHVELVAAAIIADVYARVASTPVARVFTSKDPLVGDLATRIDAAAPGRVVGVNRVVRDPVTGAALTDLDIELTDAVIQVKGGAKLGGAVEQVAKSAELTGKDSFLYGPNLRPGAAAEAQRQGVVVFRTWEELKARLGL